jgi:hypothetical protein
VAYANGRNADQPSLCTRAGERARTLDWTALHSGLDCTRTVDWTGLDWTGLDWTGLDWTGLHTRTGLDCTRTVDYTGLCDAFAVVIVKHTAVVDG